METPGAAPYRRTDEPAAPSPGRALSDPDVVGMLAVLAPVFLAVVAHAIAGGEVFGAGQTVCGAMVIAAAVAAIAARRR
jgi:hypothetical protein